MCRDIVTQSQNLDKIILRNVVVAQATWWGWCTSAVFDARGASISYRESDELRSGRRYQR